MSRIKKKRRRIEEENVKGKRKLRPIQRNKLVVVTGRGKIRKEREVTAYKQKNRDKSTKEKKKKE